MIMIKVDFCSLCGHILLDLFYKNIFRAYQFKLEEVEAFRYRAKDAWKAVTRIAVREARLKEIKQEIFNCQKLKVSCSLTKK